MAILETCREPGLREIKRASRGGLAAPPAATRLSSPPPHLRQHPMKPILILQNQTSDGPAYLAQWLSRARLPMTVCNTEAGDDFPASMAGFSALALLGGEMSANDELPSLRRAERLILEAMRDNKPVIGHCLGGQLMARALGAPVHASPLPEVGWQTVHIEPTAAARRWFGTAATATVFQWHYEAFGLPPGAERLAGNAACPNQAFAIGPHLAMQFHIEVDAEKLTRWSQEDSELHREAVRRSPATVQDGAAIRAGIAAELAAHQALADPVYATWLQAVAR